MQIKRMLLTADASAPNVRQCVKLCSRGNETLSHSPLQPTLMGHVARAGYAGSFFAVGCLILQKLGSAHTIESYIYRFIRHLSSHLRSIQSSVR